METSSINGEIHKLIDEKINSGIVVNVDWITHAILQGKMSIEGEDAPFYRVCGYKVVSKMVKRAIGKYDAEDTTEATLLLPGFKHLCKAYAMQRKEGTVLVPVDLCTDAELHSRAGQLDDMAKGCRSHAREIREYVATRKQASAA